MNVLRASKAKKSAAKLISGPKEHSLADYVNSPSKSANVWKETFGTMLVHPKKKGLEPELKPRVCLDQDIERQATVDVTEKTTLEETLVSENVPSSSQKAGVGQESKLQPSAGSVSL